ncbi:MAG: hypothetical protein AVDCRST_MAG27-1845, partial [uncultured Craurococcus sp.]
CPTTITTTAWSIPMAGRPSRCPGARSRWPSPSRAASPWPTTATMTAWSTTMAGPAPSEAARRTS